MVQPRNDQRSSTLPSLHLPSQFAIRPGHWPRLHSWGMRGHRLTYRASSTIRRRHQQAAVTHNQRVVLDSDRQLGLRFQWLSLLSSLMALHLALLVLSLNVDGLIGIILLVTIGVAFLTLLALFLINLWRADRRAEHVRERRHRREHRSGLLLG